MKYWTINNTYEEQKRKGNFHLKAWNKGEITPSIDAIYHYRGTANRHIYECKQYRRYERILCIDEETDEILEDYRKEV